MIHFLSREYLRSFSDILQQIDDLLPTTHVASYPKFTIFLTEPRCLYRTERTILQSVYTIISDESQESITNDEKVLCGTSLALYSARLGVGRVAYAENPAFWRISPLNIELYRIVQKKFLLNLAWEIPGMIGCALPTLG